MALLTVGMIGFIVGVVLAAGLLGPLGFGVVLALIAVGHGLDRRRLPPAARSPDDRARPPHPRRHRLPRRRAAVRGRRRRHAAATISLVTLCHKDAPPPEAREVVDGRGLMLCPGFIDLHTHSALRSFDDPLLTPKLAQGFTTEVINPDGLAPAPGRARAARRSARRTCGRSKAAARRHGRGRRSRSTSMRSTRRGPALSLVPSIGHGAVRELVLGGGRVDPDRRAAAGDAPRGPPRPRGGRTHAVVRARLPAGRLRRHRRARRGRRGGRRPSARRSSPTSATRATGCSRRSPR